MQPQGDSPEQIHPLLRGNQRFFSPKEMADIVDMSITWVYDQCDQGKIRHGRRGRNIKIPRSEAIRLEKELQAQCDSGTDSGPPKAIAGGK